MVHEHLSDMLTAQGNIPKPGPRPKLSDAAIIALSLTSEILSIDSENRLFMQLRQYPKVFPTLIDRSGYNVRRRKLFSYTNHLRNTILQKISSSESVFIIDTMPLPVCKLARANRSRICKESFETAPDKGFCAAQQTYFHGYKLHSVCTQKGVFTSFDLSKASVHDIHYLKNVKEHMANAILLGDKGYLSEDIQIDLFTSVRINLQTPLRSNQKNYVKQPSILRKTRKRIETLFSQLCDQFMIHRNYAKSFDGFKARILAKITALTISQFFNYQNQKNLNLIKYAFI
ncbi:MAG TPA: IS982 family transposase [bacterium]|nr:IS982 family transposase [bacterium]HMW35179.1 IS982 family transposase [bacterium]HMY36228.1 IS982 family transposase [bacterium]HMZ03844.1 IS982 family transposase [bacterium]HNB10504.1 IS982 family transposase [bacterium]